MKTNTGQTFHPSLEVFDRENRCWQKVPLMSSGEWLKYVRETTEAQVLDTAPQSKKSKIDYKV